MSNCLFNQSTRVIYNAILVEIGCCATPVLSNWVVAVHLSGVTIQARMHALCADRAINSQDLHQCMLLT